MVNYFAKQLESCLPIDEMVLKNLKGRSIYGEYEVGDTILYFFVLKDSDILELRTVTLKDMDKFLLEYTYCAGETTPVFFKNI